MRCLALLQVMGGSKRDVAAVMVRAPAHAAIYLANAEKSHNLADAQMKDPGINYRMITDSHVQRLGHALIVMGLPIAAAHMGIYRILQLLVGLGIHVHTLLIIMKDILLMILAAALQAHAQIISDNAGQDFLMGAGEQ